MKKNRILIVGGTGFLGSNLALYLIKKKFEITIIHTRNLSKKNKIKNIKYLKVDISNNRSLKKVSNVYYDYVINFAGYVDHSKKKQVYKSHYTGCRNLVNLFKNKNIKLFIQIGSSTEYGHLKSPQSENKIVKIQSLKSHYSRAKFLATKYIENTKNFPYVIFRLYLVYGPGQKTNRLIPIIFQNALKNKKFDCSEGSQIRNFLYINDFINAVYKCLKIKPNRKIINLGSKKSYTVKHVINKIVKICKGGKPNYGVFKLRKDEPMRLYPSLKNAKKYLNWSSSINLNTGLVKTMSFYKRYVK